MSQFSRGYTRLMLSQVNAACRKSRIHRGTKLHFASFFLLAKSFWENVFQLKDLVCHLKHIDPEHEKF